MVLFSQGVCAREFEILCKRTDKRIGTMEKLQNAGAIEKHNENLITVILLKYWFTGFVIGVCFVLLVFGAYFVSKHQITYGPDELPRVRLDGIKVIYVRD